MGSWADEVVSKWESEGVKINVKAFLEEIVSAETTLDFKFPEDFKELYSKANGFQDMDWQEHMFYFWPLERIVEEYSESSDKNFIGFCDFLIASHYIGFKKDQAGIFKMYSTLKQAEDVPIAQTFEEVVGMINSSNNLIY